MPADPVLRVTRAGERDDIVVLTLDRPAALNAIDDALLAALHDALDGVEAAATDPMAVRGVVLAGAGGRAFSTGMDLKERASFDDARLRAQRTEIVRLVTRVHELPVPVIAGVEGYALAGGFELALACDLIVASRGAVFGLPEVAVGIFPGGGGTQTLTWLVGPARARDVILTGRRLTADEAEAWGVVARVVDEGTALEAAVGLATTIGTGAPLGIRAARRAIAAAHRALADGLAQENELYETVLVSDDRREGFRAFAEKRPARFRGR
ncbi:MAG TPA: enoyl-CoA hydratase/isomerase family protein [Candidatus Limnocylindrales bacterium]|nr:enoyl-CoA hydratase/isomerase family protein [Candidatus Limnocylindrales bacterium]